MLGKFYGIGVGPGDPEFMTLKACKVLKEVDVVCFPVSQPNKPSIALQIASQAAQGKWEVLELYLPMTKDNSKLEEHWQEGALKVAQVLQAGKDAAFITLGDPSFYSTFIYLMRKLKMMVDTLSIEIIPGVSAPNALAAQAQVPLAESEENLLIIPAINNLDEIKQALDDYDNIMLMKVGRAFADVLALLREKDLDKKAVFGSRCGFNDGFISYDLEGIKDKPKDYLSSMLIKKNG